MTKHKRLKMMESRAHKDIFTFSSKQCFMELLRNAAKHRGMEENRNCWSEPKTNSLVGHHIPPKMFHLQLIFLRQVAHKVHRNVCIYLTIQLPICLSVFQFTKSIYTLHAHSVRQVEAPSMERVDECCQLWHLTNSFF